MQAIAALPPVGFKFQHNGSALTIASIEGQKVLAADESGNLFQFRASTIILRRDVQDFLHGV